MSGRVRDDWRLIVGVVSGGHFLSHFYLLTLPPLFPLLRDEFGLTNTEFGLLVSVVAVGGLLQAPVGDVVDRIGAKWVFVVGVGVTGGGIALIALGPTYPAILALAVVTGVGQSAFHPSDYALIDAVTGPGVQGRAFSVHTFSGYAGFAAAPVVVGALAFVTGWRSTLFVVGAVGLAYAALAAVVLAPAHRPDAGAGTDADGAASAPETGVSGSFRSALGRPGILVMVGVFLLVALASKGIQTFTTVLAVDAFGLGESVGNTLLTAYFSLGAVGVLVGGVLADRFAPDRVIVATLVVGASILCVTVSGLAPGGILPLTVLFGLAGFFITLVLPSRDRLVSGLSAEGSMGRSFGVVFTGGTVGALVGPVLLGAVGDAASITLAFLLVGAFYFVVAGLVFSLGQGWLTPTTGTVPADGD